MSGRLICMFAFVAAVFGRQQAPRDPEQSNNNSPRMSAEQRLPSFSFRQPPASLGHDQPVMAST
jgi:hypothetical protein